MYQSLLNNSSTSHHVQIGKMSINRIFLTLLLAAVGFPLMQTGITSVSDSSEIIFIAGFVLVAIAIVTSYPRWKEVTAKDFLTR